MSEIKFVYFDIGGVLFNWKIALKNLAKHLDRSYESVKAVFERYDEDVCRGKITPDSLWQYYKTELNVGLEINDFADWWTDKFTPIKQMHDLARDISKKYRVGILTNVYEGAYIKMIEKGHVPNIDWETVIQSCELNLVKPEDDFFLYAQRKANVLPSEILFIDDSQKNIDKAKKLGWQGVRFDEINPEDTVKNVRKILKL
ncbi:MAG: HAD-IA family hydrolase [bacterium]|nr:HAD-IA family hydrolase [bacterium]